MKTFYVVSKYTEYGIAEVEAESAEEAKKLAKEHCDNYDFDYDELQTVPEHRKYGQQFGNRFECGFEIVDAEEKGEKKVDIAALLENVRGMNKVLSIAEQEVKKKEDILRENYIKKYNETVLPHLNDMRKIVKEIGKDFCIRAIGNEIDITMTISLNTIFFRFYGNISGGMDSETIPDIRKVEIVKWWEANSDKINNEFANWVKCSLNGKINELEKRNRDVDAALK